MSHSLMFLPLKSHMLTHTGKTFIRQRDHRRMVECVCDCGNITEITVWEYRNGKVKSCGCLHIKHGLLNHPLYTLYSSIKTRCYCKKHKNYKDYGGKGIIMCSEWKVDFNEFYNWSISNGWKIGLTLDRKKNKLGYSPENCRWATVEEQARNRTNNIFLTAFGETKCTQDWANDPRCKVGLTAVNKRIREYGWSAEDAISKPSMNKTRGAKSNSIFVVFGGETLLLGDLCINLGVNYRSVRSRLYMGWDVERAISQPLIKHNK